MNTHHLQDIELGKRVALYFVIENELHRDTRASAIAWRACLSRQVTAR